MAYDLHHKNLGIKAIGTVESGLKYDSVNYNDPITVGVAQWYGTRAAKILNKMRTSGTWTGVASSVTNDLTSHSETSKWWTTRYLTKAEGSSLKATLIANKAIQNAQFRDDLDDYVDTAESLGMDKDSNTLAVLFFASMEHQGPLYARRVLQRAGPTANLTRLHAQCLNDPVLGKYRNRYNEVKKILESGDTSGVDDTGGAVSEDDEGGDPGAGGDAGDDGIKYLQVWGDQIKVRMKSGGITWGKPTGHSGIFYAGGISDVGATVPDEPLTSTPSVPPTADVAAKQSAIKAALTAKLGDFKYSQALGRLTPESSGYTDCSALLYFYFRKVLGITLGTYTGTQRFDGEKIAEGKGSMDLGKLQVGDLILYDWGGFTAKYDHVELYYGGGQVIGHGGPMNGPRIGSAQSKATRATRWLVRRVIK